MVVTAAEAEADQQETSAENSEFAVALGITCQIILIHFVAVVAESMESESNGTGVVGEGRESKRRGGGGGDGDGGPEEQEQHPAKKIKTEEGTEEVCVTELYFLPRIQPCSYYSPWPPHLPGGPEEPSGSEMSEARESSRFNCYK